MFYYSILGSNARLSYSLKKENTYFGIDTKTGIIFVKKSLKTIVNKTLTLLAVVKDHGENPFSGNAKLIVCLYRFLFYYFKRFSEHILAGLNVIMISVIVR